MTRTRKSTLGGVLSFAIPRFTTVEVDGVLIHPDRDGYVRMLPSYWEKIKPALRDLDFDAQEYVCQTQRLRRDPIDPAKRLFALYEIA